MKIKIIFFLLTLAFLLPARADDAPYKLAKSVLDQRYRDQVLSVYGVGTPSEINKWYITFYDPSSPTGARVVVIRHGKIDKFAPTSKKEKEALVPFDPEKSLVSVQMALKTARKYAQEAFLYYDITQVLLERKNDDSVPQWQVEFIYDGNSRGSVLINPLDGSFVRYIYTKKSEKDFDEVESTFLGVGGDLEQFFTGHRSVDQ